METARILTLGQTGAFADLINWGLEKDVIDGLELIIDCSLVRHPSGINSQLRLLATIIDRVSGKDALEILLKWSNHNSYAYNLYKLINAYNSCLPEHLKAEPYSESKPARLQLHGELEIYYLVSCLIEQKPNKSAETTKWYEQLKIWLVLKAMCAANFRIIQDENLRVIFRYLRIAAERQSSKLDLLNALMVDAHGFYPFTRTLEHKANQLLENSRYKDTDAIFLRALIKIRNDEFNPDKNQQVISTYQSGPRFQTISQLNIQNKNNDDEIRLSNENLIIDLSEEDEPDFGIEAKVNSQEENELRLLKGNSILLNTIEELQFLPWQWNKINPYEIDLFIESNNKLLTSDKEEEKILAVIIWVAMKTGRSLRRVQNVQFGEFGNEWTINLAQRKLIRNQPRRSNAWLPKTEEEKKWILPLVDKQEIEIPDVIVEIIEHALCKVKVSKANYLQELWDETQWGGAEKKFLDVFRNTLPRITPGMLSSYLPQKIYELSENEKLTRLLASHPNTGLPPASAYAAWLKDEHPQVLSQFILDIPSISPNKINAGSSLYPVESLIVEAINKAGSKLEEVRKKGYLIEYHNCLTGYIYTMILAASGCRPISDLAETISQFDFENNYFYVDDKSTSRGNKGRLLTIPERLVRYLKSEYLAHLRIVANEIKTINAKLAEEIINISQAKHSSKLPFLFLLKANTKVDWTSVTHSEVQKMDLFEWPLPSNLFRHRLAKLLPREGVSQEIVDGFLGHMESGLETYGDYSTRCFVDDVKTLRPAVNKIFDKLGFAYPRHQPYLKIDKSTMHFDEFKIKLFGTQNRANERKARIENAIKSVRWEIEKSLTETSAQNPQQNSSNSSHDYPVERLSEQQIEVLSKTMLFYSSGLPRADGLLRYSYLLKCINRRAKNTTHKVKLKRQYFFSETYSPFTSLSINSQTKYKSIRTAITELHDIQYVSRIGVKETALLSTLIFSIENRVADLKMLKNAFKGKYYRVIKLNETYYVEFSSEEFFKSSLPCVKRIPISETCAFWMQRTKKLNIKDTDLNSRIPKEFKSVKSSIFELNQENEEIETVEKLLKAIAQIIDQVNVIELPGVVAGALSGRVGTYSWGWTELIRFKMGASYSFDFKTYLENHPEANEIAEEEYVSARTSTTSGLDEEALKKSTKELFKEVRRVLSKAETKNTSKNTYREEYIKSLYALTNNYKDKVSQSSLLLVDWVIRLIKTKRTSTRYLAISTIERYFSALSTKFELLAYAINLIELDEDEITELYSQIIQLSKERDRPYVGVRLLSFHRWARELKVSEPDWEEVDVPDQQDAVSPGFIFENDYQNAIKLLVKATSIYDINNYYCALLLLFTFRFGLRGNEALGLLSSDIFIKNESLVISVQDNKVRKLKNKASRRQVPLIFDLSETEKYLINWSQDHLGSIQKKHQSATLFNNEGQPLNRAEKARIKQKLNELLKQVTSNPTTTIHHARHTAANKITYSLVGVSLHYKKKCSLELGSHPVSILLGTESNTRRKTWATARYLGHATRITQLKSYIHFVWDWAAIYAEPIVSKNLGKDIEGVLNIDQYVVKSASLDFKLSEQIDVEKIKVNITLLDLFQLFRLLANGKDVELAAEALGVPLDTAQYAYNLLSAASDKNYRLNSKDGTLGVFEKASQAVWDRLFEYVKSINQQDFNKPIFTKDELQIDKVLPMFGGRGQVLMNTEAQFKLMEAFIELFQVSQSSYDVLAPKNLKEKYLLHAQKCNLRPVICGSATELGQKYKSFKIDSYYDKVLDQSSDQRCAVHFTKVNFGYARNSNNWTLLLIIYIAFLKSN